MTDTARARTSIRLDLVSELAAAYVLHNAVPVADLPGLIASLGAALERLASGRAGDAGTHRSDGDRGRLATTEIRKSVTHDALISFLNGKPYRTLKLHLSSYGLTADEYRARFGLPADYPMVSPSYSERRAAIARSIGLGTKPRPRGKAQA
jgi:predicted transcriptional regulator